MKRVLSLPLMKHCAGTDHARGKECGKNGVLHKHKEEDGGDEIDDVEEQVQCITLHKREPTKRGEDQLWENYGLWRQEQKMRAARLEKQLKARWALEELIEEQLNRFNALYNQKTMVPARLKDVSQILMAKGSPAHELATLAWLGDWRPSAVLDLLRSLARSSSSLSMSLSDTAGIERILNQLIHDIRIEEAVIDEEMTEIQATCIFHLPFASIKDRQEGPALASVQSEFKKIHRVITKAQKLRFKALQLVVKKVLNQTDAAEFLVVFARIQDLIHQFATQHRLRKGPVSVPVKAS